MLDLQGINELSREEETANVFSTQELGFYLIYFRSSNETI